MTVMDIIVRFGYNNGYMCMGIYIYIYNMNQDELTRRLGNKSGMEIGKNFGYWLLRRAYLS